MNAQELAEKFTAKIAVAAVEKDRQTGIAADNAGKRTADIEHCKKALEQNVIPFLEELKHHLGEQQFSFAPQIEMNDHRPVGVSFRIGDGAPSSITTAFGNIAVTASVIAGLPKAFPLSMRPTLNLIFRTQAISRAIRLQSSLRWLSIRLGAEADSAIPNLSGFGRPRRIRAKP